MSETPPTPAPRAPSVRLVDAAGLGACVLLLGAAYLLGLEPRLRQRAEAVQRRSDLDATHRELATISAQFREREGVAERLAAELKTSALRLSSVRDANRRIEAIVLRAKECGLKVAEVVPGATAQRGSLTIVPIKVRGHGGYAGVTDFLAGLRAEFPDTAVSALTLSGTVAGDVPAEFSVEFAWYTDPNATSRAASALSPD